MAAPPSTTAETLVSLASQPQIQAVGADFGVVKKAGIVVTADIESGDAIVVDGATATTDAEGIAHFSNLTLGAASETGGAISVRFSAPGLTPVSAPVQLTCAVTPLTLGVTATGTIAAGDCARTDDHERYKLFSLDAPAGTKALLVADTSTAFLPTTGLSSGGDATNGLVGSAVSGQTGVALRFLVPPGAQRITAGAAQLNATGAFRLRVTAAPEEVASECYVLFTHPLSTNQTLSTNCATSNRISESYYFNLRGGATANIIVASSAFTPSIELRQYSPDASVASNVATGTTATISYTNTDASARLYYLVVSSPDGTGTGSYTVQSTLTIPGWRADDRAEPMSIRLPLGR